MTNILVALRNIVNNPVTELVSFYNGSNRANNMGDALETYIKDIFCDSLSLSDSEKDIKYSESFSYLGNQNNPPDIIIKNGDAIEVKKIESLNSAIALNSSYPKNKLHNDDTRITSECRNCESIPWASKDIIYVIGVSLKNSKKLKAIWFIYGDCYCSDRSIYQRVADKISEGILCIPDVELVKTNELAKVKKVDPLGITDLRVRGMWHIENPIKVFQNIARIEKEDTFTVHAIIPEEKYYSFPEVDRRGLEDIQDSNFAISDTKIKSPDNPAKLLNVKHISYAK